MILYLFGMMKRLIAMICLLFEQEIMAVLPKVLLQVHDSIKAVVFGT